MTENKFFDAAKALRLTVAATEAGERLDRLLAARPLGYSRSTLQSWIEAGRVEIDGAIVVDRRSKSRAGATVVIYPAPPPVSDALPQAMDLDILHEDEALLVLNKPAGLVVHPACGHADSTLVNGLLHHTQLADADQDQRRPGIVHRLDKDTSGIMVVAKTDTARQHLTEQFQAHSIERAYLAIAIGAPPLTLTIDTAFGRHRRDRKRFTSRLENGRRAITHVRRLRGLHGSALVECRLETGRTHQIRVHLSEHGWPILGDPLYGKAGRDPRLRAAAARLNRQALHAAVLGFVHPTSGETLRFETAPPIDFQQALEALDLQHRPAVS